MISMRAGFLIGLSFGKLFFYETDRIERFTNYFSLLNAIW